MIRLTELEVSILKYIENHGASTDNIYYEFKEEYDYIHCQELINGLIKKGYLRPDSDYYYITESGITYLYELGIEDKETGYKESEGKIYYDIDWQFVQDLGELMFKNKEKYERGNWKKDLEIKNLEDSLERHFMKYKLGQTDELHDVAICANIMMLRYLKRHNNG